MKFKNYKSAIHNFTHSFISIDYMKSGRLAVNVLIDLYNHKIETKATFDFLNEEINPEDANSKESNKLLVDYMTWMPELFENHNCDINRLEKLFTTIWIDFENIRTPPRMNDTIELEVNAKTIWKAEGREEQTIKIKQTELIKKVFLNLGIPEMK